jgi:hypothetical protein
VDRFCAQINIARATWLEPAEKVNRQAEAITSDSVA